MSWLSGMLLLIVVQAGPAVPASAPDSVLAGLLHEALANRPELAQAQAVLNAERARVPQVRALPDPVVSLGVQNDEIGSLHEAATMTTWWSYSASQTLPLAGQPGLRGRAQALAARQSESDLERVRLSVTAEVERAYVELLLVRDRLGLLDRVEALWAQSEGLARSRYETGRGAQSDILRAQLERSRLRQRRWALLSSERQALAELNRAAGRAEERPVTTDRSLAEWPDPALPDSAQAEADADARCPELRRARLGLEQARTNTTLAHREWLPDVTLSGSVMPRGELYDPMWRASVSVPLPLWAPRRSSRAVAESRQRTRAAEHGAESVHRQLHQRLEERRAVLGALLESNRIYRSGLLIQSEAAVSSVLAQYQVGAVPFASVLEALGGWFGDLENYYESIAATHRVDIAQRELSLDPIASAPTGLAARGAMPGAAGMTASPARTPTPAPRPASSAMPGM